MKTILKAASGIVIPATFQLVHLIRSQEFHQCRVMELSPVFCDDMANSQMPVEFHIRHRYKNWRRDQGGEPQSMSKRTEGDFNWMTEWLAAGI